MKNYCVRINLADVLLAFLAGLSDADHQLQVAGNSGEGNVSKTTSSIQLNLYPMQVWQTYQHLKIEMREILCTLSEVMSSVANFGNELRIDNRRQSMNRGILLCSLAIACTLTYYV